MWEGEACAFVTAGCVSLEAGAVHASGPNTISWHFVFSDALRCWAPAFLTGMAFLGLQKIIDLLKERGE